MQGLSADQLANIISETLKKLQNAGRRRFRGATMEKNPDKNKGRGYTKSVHNPKKAKVHRKMAKASRKKNRRK